jgi:DNA-binding NarL/FixJ family response regulator
MQKPNLAADLLHPIPTGATAFRPVYQPQTNPNARGVGPTKMNHILEPMPPEVIRFEKTTFKLKPLKVAIVDGGNAAHEPLAALIAADGSCRVVRHCPDAESALNHLPAFNPDVVLLEINLPGMDGVECMRRLKAQMPGLHVIIFTACEDQNRLLASLIAGASGCLAKCTPPERLVAAIHEAYNGGAPMSPEIACRVLQHLRQTNGTPSEKLKLTPREQEILDQLSKGFRYKEIVDNLGISFGTLHSYISKVYEKLHVHSRTEAVVKYLNL